MNGRRILLAVPALLFALSCENPQAPSDGLRSPTDPSKIISDGAHGGNKDFFFLPPMVPIPLNNPDFELGKFNNALRPSLRIEICELNADHLTTAPSSTGLPAGLPTGATTCGAIKKTFAPGSVNLVNLPLRENGWWNLFKLPPDGFYYALWDTRSSNLNVNKYYRIKVFVAGIPDALGVADVDPMSSLSQWKYSLTGEVIQLVDDVMLPITFRVERGALCEGGTCNSATITNTGGTATAPQTVKVDAGGGSIAGASFPNGWLPAYPNYGCTPTNSNCPQSVVVTITEVSTSQSGVGFAAAAPTVCHPDLDPRLTQFRGCFNYSTTPTLRAINEAGDQFAQPVTVAVCFELQGTDDQREPFAQLYGSGPNEPSHPLDDIPEGTLLGATSKDCSRPPVIGLRGSNPLVQFASAGWNKLRGGLGRVFGVKTAYAVDLGLGGIVKGFTNISPVLNVGIQAASSTNLTLEQGQLSTTVMAKIVANHYHPPTGPAPGVNDVAVTFTQTGENNATIKLVNSVGTGIRGPLTVNTATVSTNGIAQVEWTFPGPGTYTMTADGPATGGPVTYTAIVPAAPAALANPVLAYTGAERYSTGAGTFVRYNLAVTNYQAYPVEMFAAAPSLPPCGGNTNSSRTWVNIYNASTNAYIYGFCALGTPSDLQSIWFALPPETPPPAQVYVKLIDRAPNPDVEYTSNSVAPIFLPDLGVSSGPSVPNPVVMPGGYLTLGATTFNNVGGNFTLTGGARFGVYLSTDATITSGDSPLCGANATPGNFGSLETGGSYTVPILACLLPEGLAPGAYYIGVVIDDNGLLVESNEANNSSAGQAITVAAPAPIIGGFGLMDAGDSHTCALRQTGVAVCWGYSPYGQMNVPAAEVLHQVSGGFATTCGLRANESVGCWGSDGSGQVNVVLGTYTKVSAGSYQVCGLRTDQQITCWGSNDQGQSTFPEGLYIDVGAGVQRSCAVRTTGAIVCVGYSIGADPSGTFSQVSVGSGQGGHACAIRSDNSITCWGNNDYHQVDRAPTTGSFKQISAGAWFSCALRDDGAAVCWGSDFSAPNNQPGLATPPAGPFERITAGANFACGQRSATNIVCWGQAGPWLTVPAEFQV